MVTKSIVPVLAQVISWVEPEVKLSPPLGEVTVMVGPGSVVISNTVSLVSMGSPSISLICTRQVVEGVLGIVQS